MPIDEGPSPDDLERFGGDTGHCPRCGAKIWDQAPQCPKCGDFVEGETLSRPPYEQWWRRRWVILVALIALAAFVMAVIW